MPKIKLSDGTRLHYLEEGSGDPILFLHGWYTNGIYFRRTANRLKDSYRCIRYDQRGWGLSDSPVPERTIDRLVHDLRELIEQLGLENICLVGHSMGALVIYGYVEKYGCDHLSSIMLMDMSPKPLSDPEWEHGTMAIGSSFRNTPFEETDNRMRRAATAISSCYFGMLGSTVPAMLEGFAYIEQMFPFMVPTRPYPTVIADYWLAMLNADYRKAVPRLTVPVTYVQPERSVYPASVAAHLEEYSNAPVAYELYKDTGHIEMFWDSKRLHNSILKLKSREGEEKTWVRPLRPLEA
ncbi:MAG: alpha/beta hydrolase [Lachnospiraceae bacterium]|nr:alpha/beta hydrolase [Lachnospiraceae bacterium]